MSSMLVENYVSTPHGGLATGKLTPSYSVGFKTVSTPHGGLATYRIAGYPKPYPTGFNSTRWISNPVALAVGLVLFSRFNSTRWISNYPKSTLRPPKL